MDRVMVGLLAAVGVATSALVPFTHGDLTWLAISSASSVTGLAAFSGATLQKKVS
jgi:hypothetical protein